MRKIINIGWKDTIVRFSSKSEFLFFLILPIFFIYLMSGAMMGGEDNEARIVLLAADEDASVLSQQLLADIAEAGTVDVQATSLDDAKARFEDEESPALLIIPAGFEKALSAGNPIELGFEMQPENSDARVVEQTVLSSATSIGRAIAAANASVIEYSARATSEMESQGADIFARSLDQARQLFGSSPARIEVTRPEEAAQADDGWSQAAHGTSGQIVTWIFIPLLGTSGILAYERRIGTLRRLLTSPTRTSTYLLGTITGQLGQASVQIVLLVAFGALALNVYWGKSILALAVLFAAFAIASVAFGTMLGAFVKTDGQASNLSIMAGMAMALLGGCWYPLELFPAVAQKIVRIFPTTWAMMGLTDLTMRGKGLVAILPAAGVLLAFSAIFFFVGIRRFRYE